jgi:ubiquinone biosynthesis UbiH/UbiF/VisC/COQ6 family hydroxylase
MTATGSPDHDVVIAGAGLVGLALAVALARAGLRVAIADRAALASPQAPAADADWDPRIYAVSPGSATLLHSLGAWQTLDGTRIAAIESMRVEGDRGALLEFSAFDLGERALAWIVEERALRAALTPLVRAAGVTVLARVEPRALASAVDRAALTFDDGSVVSARLIVGADGIRSWVRQAAGLDAPLRRYGQTAVVANFDCERAHHGCARQWFRADGGVLAWLPLPDRRMSIVWAAPEGEANELRALDPASLSSRVAEAGKHALGALTCITPPAAFPLHYLRPRATVGARVALVGDAAHGVHPLAGQGVNLGFGDVEALAAVLRERAPLDAGAPIVLERYARRRAEPVLAMQMVTDGLATLFGYHARWLSAARNMGLAAVNRLPLAKWLLAQPALR